METQTVEFTVLIQTNGDTVDEEKFELTRNLRNELLDGLVNSAEPVYSDSFPPAGIKGDPITIGALILGVAAATIPNVILLIQNWLLRQNNHTIRVRIGEVELEVPRNASKEEIGKIVSIVSRIPRKR